MAIRKTSGKKVAAKKAPAKKTAARVPPLEYEAQRDVAAKAQAIGLVSQSHVWEIVQPYAPVILPVPMRRPDDHLVARLSYRNLALVKGDAPRLARVNDDEALLILELPPQSFAEEAFLDATDPVKPVPPLAWQLATSLDISDLRNPSQKLIHGRCGGVVSVALTFIVALQADQRALK